MHYMDAHISSCEHYEGCDGLSNDANTTAVLHMHVDRVVFMCALCQKFKLLTAAIYIREQHSHRT